MLVKSWERFILTGETEPGLRNVIAESWNRCKSLGVPYDLEEVKSHIDAHEFNKRRRENELLIHAATPIMLDLYNRLKGGGYLLLLVDSEGYLIELMADFKAQTVADRGGIYPGARWVEENVGATGLSIALRTRKAMATSGYEHYCKAFRTWDCSACPIYVDGQYVGVFDVCRLGPGNDVKELFAIAVAGAKAIGERIRAEKLSYRQMIFSHTLSNYPDVKLGTGVIIFDSWGQIVHKNENAETFIRLLEEENQKKNGSISPNKMIRDLLKQNDEKNGNIKLKGSEFALELKHIEQEGKQIGSFMYIRQPDSNDAFKPTSQESVKAGIKI